MNITIKGTPTTTEGTWPTLGSKAPEFTVTDLEGNKITSESLKGQVVLISTFPDIDTRVCAIQTRKFYELASTIEDVKIINLSNNDPENLTAWCATNGIDTLMAIDTNKEFALNYGIWIEKIQHLARAVFVIDKEGTLVHSELVEELSTEPDYNSALRAAVKL